MLRLRPVALALGLAVAAGAVAVAPPATAGEAPTDELARLRSTDAELEDRLSGLERWLTDGQRRLEDLDQELRAAEQAIERAAAETARAARQVERQESMVQDRAVAAYLHPVGAAEVPLSSDVNRAAEQRVLVNQVTAYDREILVAKVDAEERLEREEAEVEQARDDLEATEDEVTDLLDGLFAQREELRSAQEALDARIVAVQAEVDAMAASQGSLVDLIIGRSGSGATSAGRLLIPVNGTLTSRYGPRWGRLHAGIDISASTGTPIRAAADGRAIYSGWMSGYGNVVIVDHGGGVSTLYAHQSRRGVVVGDALEKGEVLGEVGSTGNSTGPHLHFEVRERGTPVDPLPYLSA